jgi:cytochrome c oxidase assembly factor CtaG
MLYLGLIVIPNTLLGAAITFSDHVLYQAYAEVEQPIKVSLMTDQQIGGTILWVPGDMMSLVVAGIVMIMWYQHEESGNVASAPPGSR